MGVELDVARTHDLHHGNGEELLNRCRPYLSLRLAESPHRNNDMGVTPLWATM